MFKYLELYQKLKISKTLYFESLIHPEFRLYMSQSSKFKILKLGFF